MNIVDQLGSDATNNKEMVHFETVLFTESATDNGAVEVNHEENRPSVEKLFPIHTKKNLK